MALRDFTFTGLLKLRGAAENIDMARRALGPHATDAELRSLANYFSRVINGKVPKVSAQMLRLLAEGLGYTSMSSFFADWERVTADKPPRRKIPVRDRRIVFVSSSSSDLTTEQQNFTENSRGHYPSVTNHAKQIAGTRPNGGDTTTISPAALGHIKAYAAECARAFAAEIVSAIAHQGDAPREAGRAAGHRRAGVDAGNGSVLQQSPRRRTSPRRQAK